MTADDRRIAVRCPACGHDTAEPASFCQQCGARLDPPTPPPDASASSSDVPAVQQPDATMSDEPADAESPTAQLSTTDGAPPPDGLSTGDGDPPPDDLSQTSVMSAVRGREQRVEGRRCPRCGAGNDVRRELCVRCGADLESGAMLAQPRSGGLRSPESQARAPRRRRRWWIPILAIAAVVGAIVATFWFAELGPFASEPTVPDATFEASRYDGEPDALLLTDIATVTTRPPEGERTFTAAQMVDANPETAWHADADALPPGVTEKIDLFLAEPAWVDTLVLNNGDHADADAYEATGRILRVELVLDGGLIYEVNLLDQGRQPQYVALPEPALTTAVRLEIVESVAGSQREDIAVSDLELRGWVADSEDARLAERRADVRPAAGPIVIED